MLDVTYIKDIGLLVVSIEAKLSREDMGRIRTNMIEITGIEKVLVVDGRFKVE